MKHKNNKRIVFINALIIATLAFSMTVKAELLERIIAVVEDEVILEGELVFEVQSLVNNLQANQVAMPPMVILKKQVLERMIVDKLQRQLAKRSGIRISDEMMRNSIMDIARSNNLTMDEFRAELKNQGISFQTFENDMRNEIAISQLRARDIGTRIKVTKREVSHYLETQSESGEQKVQYHLGHILISIPEAASSTVIQTAKEKADKILAELREGADFKQAAVSFSEGANALEGGSLGWKMISQVPTLFVDTVNKMSQGEVADLIRSPSGFHIIKMLELKGLDKHIVTKTRVRHILIKTNELVNDSEAKNRLQGLKERIIDGDDFASLARSNSDDKGSAINGGDLNWVRHGMLVAPFEKAMNELEINEISDPVQTQFGWHLIQVLERSRQDNSLEYKKNLAQEEIRKSKIEEETQLWLRRLRDEAFVEINQGRL